MKLQWERKWWGRGEWRASREYREERKRIHCLRYAAELHESCLPELVSLVFAPKRASAPFASSNKKMGICAAGTQCMGESKPGKKIPTHDHTAITSRADRTFRYGGRGTIGQAFGDFT